MAKQPALDGDRVALRHPHEAAERTMGTDDAMAWDHQRDRIRATGTTNRPRRGMQLPRELAVGARLADRDLQQSLPDSLPKRSAFRSQRQSEAELRVGEIALQLPARSLGKRIGRRERALAQRKVVDADYSGLSRANTQHGKRRPHLRRVCRRLDPGERVTTCSGPLLRPGLQTVDVSWPVQRVLHRFAPLAGGSFSSVAAGMSRTARGHARSAASPEWRRRCAWGRIRVRTSGETAVDVAPARPEARPRYNGLA